jgi:hypothetical protein
MKLPWAGEEADDNERCWYCRGMSELKPEDGSSAVDVKQEHILFRIAFRVSIVG